MINRILAAFVIAAAACSAMPGVATADETGLAGMHAWRKVGKKTCMDGHQHDGSGSGATLKVAQMSAISSWAGFTAFEYGSSWGNYGLAIEKSMRCGRTGAGFQCDLTATPCRGW